MPPPSGSTVFRPDIEGLRGLAVLLVVAFHAGLSVLPGGFVGVDVFFVLSGYLITGLLVGELQATGAVAAVAFYGRRARRLLPAAALVLVTTLLLSGLVDTPLLRERVSTSAMAAAGYVSNLAFLREASDYFAKSVQTNPLLHTWSLAVEEQFYLVWPWLVLAGFRVGGLRGVRSALVVVGLLSFATSWWFTISHQPVAFYGTHARAVEFAIGGLAAVSFSRSASGGWGARLIGLLGLVLVVGAAVRFTARTPFPGVAVLVPVIGSALVLVAGGRSAAPALLSARALRWLGARSYSWYLWHWPLLVFAASLFPPLGPAPRLALAVLSLGLADLTLRFVENPVRGSPRLRRAPWTSLGLGLATTVLVLGVGLTALRTAQSAASAPGYAEITRAATDGVQVTRACPSPPTGAIGICDFLIQAPGTTLAVVGDSHALQWLPVFESLAHDRGAGLWAAYRPACPSVDVRPLLRSGDSGRACVAWRAAVLDSVLVRHPAVVVLSNFAVYLASAPLGTPEGYTRAEWRDGVRRTVSRLSRAGITVLVLEDTPHFPFDVPDCLARQRTWVSRVVPVVCAARAPQALSLDAIAAEREAVAVVAGVSFVSTTALTCPGGVCTPRIHGHVGYRDDNHLTRTAALALAPDLARAIAVAGVRLPGRPVAVAR